MKPFIDFDAIIAVNDATAIGAIEELSERGVKVPEQVAIGGFDDWELGQTIEVPLSTVKTGVEELGSEAVRLIYNNSSLYKKNYVPARLVIRKSCGCRMKIGRWNLLTIWRTTSDP